MAEKERDLVGIFLANYFCIPSRKESLVYQEYAKWYAPTVNCEHTTVHFLTKYEYVLAKPCG